MVGDDHRLRQVLANLLSNARLHTPAGTAVTARVRRAGDAVVLQVADDGPGIPPALRESLFQRFTRGDASRNSATGSTGLGLAIVHAVVTAHGGTITVVERPGHHVHGHPPGRARRLTLPATSAASTRPDAPSCGRPGGRPRNVRTSGVPALFLRTLRSRERGGRGSLDGIADDVSEEW